VHLALAVLSSRFDFDTMTITIEYCTV